MFSIYKNRWIFIIISAVIILAGVIGYFANGGFVLDIDFAGGTMLKVDMEKSFDNDAVSKVVEDAVGKPATYIQKSGDAETEVIIKITELSSEERIKLFDAIKTNFNLSADNTPLQSGSVGATMSNEIRGTVLWIVLLAIFLMLIYIGYRFELTSGVAAIIALLHDVLIMLAVYAIFRIPVNTTFIATILTIVGYSINDTIIVFDRIRENLRFAKKGMPLEETMDKSVYQTFSRTINTALTTVIMVVVLYILGVDSVKQFALPLIVGIVSGTYSSVFIASPVWIMLKKVK